MRRLLRTLALLLVTGLAACASSPADRALSERERAELLATREEVWRAWFTGDVSALERLLTPDFIAIDPSGPLAPGREGQLEGARAFRDSGGKLIGLEFPTTEIQLLGDVAVIYTTYAVELDTPSGPERMAGRATEIFVRRDGHWLHPGWHLDRHE